MTGDVKPISCLHTSDIKSISCHRRGDVKLPSHKWCKAYKLPSHMWCKAYKLPSHKWCKAYKLPSHKWCKAYKLPSHKWCKAYGELRLQPMIIIISGFIHNLQYYKIKKEYIPFATTLKLSGPSSINTWLPICTLSMASPISINMISAVPHCL